MRLLRFLRGRQAPSPALTALTERQPLTPDQALELEQAWMELRAAADLAGVSTFRACTRDGSSWEEDPAAVRSMAATLRGLQGPST